jgi:hypothetical protein
MDEGFFCFYLRYSLQKFQELCTVSNCTKIAKNRLEKGSGDFFWTVSKRQGKCVANPVMDGLSQTICNFRQFGKNRP